VRLSKFILSNLEAIVTEWEASASTILESNELDRPTLRDDAPAILTTIAKDLEAPQPGPEQAAKSRGRGPNRQDDTPAEKHGLVRLGQGFNQVQVLSEFHALRATVVRLWMNSSPEIDQSAIYDLTRFNEGIDRAASKSAARFMEEIQESRDFAVAVLAHDLRNPLNGILSSAQCLQNPESLDKPMIGELATSIIDSGAQMSNLINNLLDFTRTRLGQTLPVRKEQVDLVPVCRQTVTELAAAHPEHRIDLTCPERIHGTFDRGRMSQMLSNLIGNAIQHGHPSTPISVEVSVESDDVIFQIHNHGAPIPEPALLTLFERPPRRRTEHEEPNNEFSHLGIGLFIVKKIVEAHSGTISVTSTPEAGTAFVIRLPCRGKTHS
jgi:signal transduction histidine kinase